jgi:hypothetical protein
VIPENPGDSALLCGAVRLHISLPVHRLEIVYPAD